MTLLSHQLQLSIKFNILSSIISNNIKLFFCKIGVCDKTGMETCHWKKRRDDAYCHIPQFCKKNIILFNII